MKKNTSWKFMDESSITFQSSVSGLGEFGLKRICNILVHVSTHLNKLGALNIT